jgi:hypothetical protein
VLLHNSKDLVYITNSGGTAWIEMTSQGKIDIFAEDSVSIHTEADFNLRADRNFNIEAGQDVNIKAFKNLNMDVSGNLSAVVAKNVGIDAKASILATAGAEVGITGSTINETASVINLKGNVVATKVDIASPASATAATSVASAIPLKTLPYNSSGAGWGNNNQYKSASLSTTMLRVPVHEPWTQHESNDPVAYSSNNTNNTPGVNPIDPNAPTGPQPLTVPLAEPIPGEWSPNANTLGSIAFTQGLGDQAHFLKATPGLRKAVQQAADTYFKAKGKPLILSSSYRSAQEQQDLYNRWVAAGGGPGNPTAGGITTPVNPNVRGGTSAHMAGIGIDTSQAPELYSMGILEACGLAWPLGLRDKVHVVLKSNPYPKE